MVKMDLNRIAGQINKNHHYFFKSAIANNKTIQYLYASSFVCQNNQKVENYPIGYPTNILLQPLLGVAF